MNKHIRHPGWLAIAALLLALFNTSALADRDGRNFHRPGHQVERLPRDHFRVSVRGKPYYYHQGVYYSKGARGYVVVGAPLGARVRSLPAGYVSFGIGSRRYFHFNSTYYLWDQKNRDYVVVEKPTGTDKALTKGTEVASAAELFVYPRNGQSEELRDQDRYECHRWARGQTGFDPSDNTSQQSMAPDYRRAISACLEGRGYTVK